MHAENSLRVLRRQAVAALPDRFAIVFLPDAAAGEDIHPAKKIHARRTPRHEDLEFTGGPRTEEDDRGRIPGFEAFAHEISTERQL